MHVKKWYQGAINVISLHRDQFKQRYLIFYNTDNIHLVAHYLNVESLL